MRIDKALENIRAVMESQEIEWLNNNGFEPVPHKPEPRMPSAPKKALSGHFAANRFLGTAPTEPIEPDEQEEQAAETASEPEIVEVIKPKDNNHSWLYNEVVKAIRDASGDGRNTKVIAVFVPVVQNGKEFEDLPVNAAIELSPVDEEAVKAEVPEEPAGQPEQEQEQEQEQQAEPEAEQAEHIDDLLPEPEQEHDAELEGAFRDIEAKMEEENIPAESEGLPEQPEEVPVSELKIEEEISAPEEVLVIEEVPESAAEIENLPEFEAGAELEEVPLQEIAVFGEPEAEQEQEIVPDGMSEFPEIGVDAEDSPEEFSAGETMQYTEIPLPNELDDEEVFDELHEDKN